MKLKIVAVSMLMTGTILTGLLSTGNADAQKSDSNVSMQNFTADEQRAAMQSGRADSAPIVLAESGQPATTTPAVATSNDSTTWNVPAAIWLAASGLAGMGLLQRRKK